MQTTARVLLGKGEILLRYHVLLHLTRFLIFLFLVLLCRIEGAFVLNEYLIRVSANDFFSNHDGRRSERAELQFPNAYDILITLRITIIISERYGRW